MALLYTLVFYLGMHFKDFIKKHIMGLNDSIY
jgi:hypothetical protein